MSPKVKISGIPSHVKISKLLPLFSDILSIKCNDFSMRVLSTKGPVNDLLLSLPSYYDARLAQRKLDNFVYKYNNITYVFSAEVLSGYNQYRNNSKAKPKFRNQHKSSYVPHQGEHQQDGSRSPSYQNKSSELDTHPEILKKKRLLMEEERKLLEEQRKLDGLKMTSINSDTSVVDTTCNKDVETCELSSKSSQQKPEIRPPTYYQSSKVLIKHMGGFINTLSSIRVRGPFLKEIRTILKQRLTMVVAEEGRDTYKTHQVLKLYRAKYPEEQDEEFVNQVLINVKKRLGVYEPNTDPMPANRTDTNEPKSFVDNHEFQEGTMSLMDTTLSDYSDDNQFIRQKTKKFDRNRLHFHNSSEAILKKMSRCIRKFCPPENQLMLKEYLRFALKERLEDVVDDKPIFETKKIINMYREQHPWESDENFVKQLLKDIEEFNIPDDVLVKVKAEQKKRERLANEIKNRAINNQTKPNEIPSTNVVTDKSGQPESKESDDQKVSNIKESKIEQSNKEKSNIEKDKKQEENIQNSSEKSNSNVEKNSSITFITDNTEEGDEIFDINDDFIDYDIETDEEPTETIQKCSDEVKVDEASHGVKRKNDEDESNRTKVAKIDDATLVISDGENKNDLENY